MPSSVCRFTLQLASALARKEKGNAAYKAGRLARAARQYNAAVEAATSIQERDLSPNPAEESTSGSSAAIMSQAKEVKKTCMNNWAAVELKWKNWAEAAKQATKVGKQMWLMCSMCTNCDPHSVCVCDRVWLFVGLHPMACCQH